MYQVDARTPVWSPSPLLANITAAALLLARWWKSGRAEGDVADAKDGGKGSGRKGGRGLKKSGRSREACREYRPVVRIVAWLLTSLVLGAAAVVMTCQGDSCDEMKVRIAMIIAMPTVMRHALWPFTGVRNGQFQMWIENFTEDVRRYAIQSSLHHFDPVGPVIRTRSSNPNRTLAPMNISMMLVGSLGDVQPYIPIAQRLKAMGHRVRIATHSQFRGYVHGHGLEFYPLGGDPKFIVAHLARSNWFVSLDIVANLAFLGRWLALFTSFWSAAHKPDITSGGKPFRADLIVASSHAFGYEHVGDWLQVPIHAVNAWPTAPTTKTPHVTVEAKEEWGETENMLTYAMFDGIPWMLLGKIVNLMRWLHGLPAVPWNRPRALIPHTFLYSPSLAPRFEDWGDHIDVVGSSFLPAHTNFTAPPQLTAWLAAGPAPIFFGFGSMVLKNPAEVTRVIVEALQRTGQRGIIQKGWGGLGEVEGELPSNVYVVDYVPHDWLLPQCSAVVHHGGSGTTGAGLKAGLPTFVVPFLTDQPFWGKRVHAVGAGPRPVQISQLTPDKLESAIAVLMRPEVKAAAERMSKEMASYDGTAGAVDSILSHLPDNYQPGVPCQPWKTAIDVTHPNYGRWRC